MSHFPKNVLCRNKQSLKKINPQPTSPNHTPTNLIKIPFLCIPSRPIFTKSPSSPSHCYLQSQTHPQGQTSKNFPTPNRKPSHNTKVFQSQIANPPIAKMDPFDPRTTTTNFEINFLLCQGVNHVEGFDATTPKMALSKERSKPTHCKNSSPQTHPQQTLNPWN
jgi:hypothetical protein